MHSPIFNFLCIFLTLSSIALAKEEEAPTSASAPQIRSEEDSFSVVQARVSTLEAKINSGEIEIKRLIEEKQHAKDPQKVNEIIQQLIQLHKQTEQNIKDYDQQRALLKYRYPEKGQIEKREYERIELKSIEEMESQMSLGSSLKRTLKKVRSQYSGDHKGEVLKESKSKKINAPPPSLVDPVILKK